MQQIGDKIRLSASDLVGHVDCHHLTALDLAATRGELERPKPWDPLIQILAERGLAHEQRYVEHLRKAGHAVVEIAGSKGVDQARMDQTLEAMHAGAPIIVQGGFLHDGWGGRTDILRRVEQESALGTWSYQVVDTKLARRTRGATLLQLCVYSELLTHFQGLVPEYMHVVKPGSGFEPESFRTEAFSAYYRWIKAGLGKFLTAQSGDATYPDPNDHCELCAWRKPCAVRRRVDDHLCLVANISTLQIGELHRQAITTTTALAELPIPLTWKPDRGSAQTYARVREQARIQVEGRSTGRKLYETLTVLPGLGLSRLPNPTAGDLFLDFEADRFVEDGGLEYLFGFVSLEECGAQKYHFSWALTREQERAAFEQFIAFVVRRLERYPDLHIYHYGHYEQAALKRLMGRYATCGDELDRMLRATVFVDLLQVVRQSIRASVERYSLKELESLFGFVRTTPLDEASNALATLNALIETGYPAAVTEDVKVIVLGYNRDDCLSAQALRNWLEGIRATLIKDGTVIDRPIPPSAEPSEQLTQWQVRIDSLVGRLTEGSPAEMRDRTAEQQGRWILAYILDWHRREDKAVWWEYYRLSGLPPEDLLEEKSALGSLTFVDVVGGTSKAPVHRYSFPSQETELRGDEPLHLEGGAKCGSVADISIERRTVDIKKRKDTASIHPTAVFAHKHVGTKELAEALARIGAAVAERGFRGGGDYGTACALLLREPPRLGGAPLRLPGETALAASIRIAQKLQGGILPIQGPPGTGKTYIGARMICSLITSGAKVGITAHSHKVIRNLLDAVREASVEAGQEVRCVQKLDSDEDDLPNLVFVDDNETLFSELHGRCNVAAGTAWLWARPEAMNSVDVLFVDEAAQMSLANVLAVSHAGKSLVLLGDPRQLDQPTKGTHPDGTSVSALDYILNGQQTIGLDQGIFLADTWRLHPNICDFTSEIFYGSRLKSIDGLERQEIRSRGRLRGTGLRTFLVSHRGNQSSAPEEADVVRHLVHECLNSNTTWVDWKGIERAVELRDILIIAPYNAQVFELQARLPGARIGTVDKFQGQEAPIVIYSMTTSTHADAPRGMGFLYNLNRLNVATSRARCLNVLVCSPDIFEPECRTPEQMQMANAFCRYREMATEL